MERGRVATQCSMFAEEITKLAADISRSSDARTPGRSMAESGLSCLAERPSTIFSPPQRRGRRLEEESLDTDARDKDAAPPRPAKDGDQIKESRDK